MKNQWGLFKGKRKKGVVWYYWYYDDKGIRQHQSTGKSVKWRAEESVKEKFAQNSTNPNIILNEFATDFFDYETSRWIKRRIARGYEVTRPMARMRAGHLKNHILNAFGSKKITEIRAIEIEDWLLNLDKKSNTKNHILGTFTIVMNEAKRSGIMETNPVDNVERISKSDYEKTDSLSIAEIKELFPKDTGKLRKIWRRDDLIVIYFLMISSGIRSGEARALIWKNIAPFKKENDFVFAGKNGILPIGRDIVSKEFSRALDRAEIKTDGRNLRTHSLRHTYNTIMKGVLTADMLREFTGHRSEQMTQRYDHPHLIDRLKQFEHSKDTIEKTWSF